MRCLDCGGEMVLMSANEDWSMPVLGFSRETHMCPGCGQTDQRTAFNKEIKEKHQAEIEAILTAPPLAPSMPIDDRSKEQGFLERVLAKIRGQ